MSSISDCIVPVEDSKIPVKITEVKRGRTGRKGVIAEFDIKILNSIDRKDWELVPDSLRKFKKEQKKNGSIAEKSEKDKKNDKTIKNQKKDKEIIIHFRRDYKKDLFEPIVEGSEPFHFQSGLGDYFKPSIPVNITVNGQSDILNALDNAVSALHAINDNFTQVAPHAAHSLSTVNTVTDFLDKNKDIILLGFVVCITLHVVLSRSSVKKKIAVLSILGIAIMWRVTDDPSAEFQDLKLRLMNSVSDLKDLWASRETEEYFEPQALDTNAFSGLLLGFLSYKMVGKNLFSTNFESGGLLKFLNDYGQKRDNIRRTTGDILGLFENVMNYICTTFLGTQPIHITSSGVEELDLLMAKVDDVTFALKEGRFEVNMSNYNYVFNLVKELDVLAKRNYDREHGERLRHLIGCYRYYLNKIVVPFERAALHASGARMEPLTVMFKGPPGVGKSYLMEPTLIRLMGKVFPKERKATLKEDFRSNVFHRSPESKYWEGYRGQFATMIDDFGQFRDSVGNADSEYMDIIRCSNLFPHTCHMASMENKGNTWFRSEVLFATTNLTEMAPVSIIEPAAVERRFDFTILVEVKREYSKVSSNGRQDRRQINKAHPLFSDGKIHTEIWDFHILEGFNGRILKTYNYEELVQALADKYLEKKGNNCHYQEAIQEALSKACCDEPLNMDDVFELAMEPQGLDMTSLIQSTSSVVTCPRTVTFSDGVLDEWIKAKNYIKESYTALKERIVNNAVYKVVEPYKRVIAVVAIAGAAYGAFSALTGLFTASDDELTPESRVNHSGRSGKQKMVRVGRTSRAMVSDLHRPIDGGEQALSFQCKDLGTDLYPEGCNIQFEVSVDNIMERNTFNFTFSDMTEMAGSLVFVYGQTFIIPKHYISWYNKVIDEDPDRKDHVFTANNFDGETFTFRASDLKVARIFEDRDIAFGVAPSVKLKKDITHMFAKEVVAHRIGNTLIRLVNRDGGKQRIYRERATIVRRKRVNDYEGGTYEVSRAWMYPIPTRKGDCGSLLFLEMSNSNSERICGLHIAGNLDCGLGAFVCQEDIVALKGFYPEALPFKGNFKELGSCKFLPGQYQTKIIPSPLRNTYAPSIKMPARLRPFLIGEEVVHPRHIAIEKYGCEPNHKIDPDTLEAAVDNYFNLLEDLAARDKECEFRVLTFDEAVVGCGTEDKYIRAIPRDTSPGYPYNTDRNVRKCGGKKYFFGDGEAYDLSRPETASLRDDVIKIIEDAKHGVRNDLYYTDVLKDELRSLAKVATGDTRLVSASPLHYTLAVRMYFAKLTSFMMRQGFRAGTAVGVNPYSRDWHNLAEYLSDQGQAVIDGDFKCFDGSHLAIVHKMIIKRIIKLMSFTGDDARACEVLYEDLYKSKHVSETNLYEWQNSLPSGHPLTTVINSIYNNIAFRYIWMVLHPKGDLGISEFNSEVNLVVYGDDNIINVSPNVLHWFNQVTFVEAFKCFGLTYTSADKNSQITPYKDLLECTFLKRGFRWSPIVERFVAPLCLETIMESPQWTKRGDLSEVVVLQNVDNMLYELSLHPQAIYEEFLPKLITAFKEHVQYVPQTTTYRLLHRMVCAREDFY